MEKVRLGDIAKVIIGISAPKIFIDKNESNAVPFIRAGLLENLCNGKDKFVEYLDKEKYKTVPKNTIIFAKSGMSVLKDRVFCLKEESIIVGHLAGIICSSQIYYKYLEYYLKYNKPSILNQNDSYPSIRAKDIENIILMLPDIEKQKEISNKLDYLKNIINIRKKQIEKVDELIKSQFVEMFKSGNYPKEELGKICNVRDGTHDSPKYLEKSEYKFITSKNIVNNEIDFSEVKYISKIDYDKFNARSKVNYGDILMPMIGTIGKPIIVNIPDNEIDFAIKNVALIKFTEDSKVTNIYIKNLFDSDYFENAIFQNKRGGTQKFIALSDIRKLEVEIPPIDIQNKFAEFVKQIDKQKFVLQKKLKELQNITKYSK